MWTKMKKLFRLNLDDLALCAGVVVGVFLLIHVITALAVKFSGEGTSLMLSGIILPIAAGVLLMILAASHVLLTFIQAVQFGQTRRRALALTVGQIGLEATVSLALAAVLTALERTFAPRFWMWLSGADYIAWGIDSRRIPEGSVFVPDPRELLIEDFALDSWWWMPLIVLSGAILGFIAGALIQRFGKKGGWFLWGLWMLFFLAFPRLPWQTQTVVDWLIPLLVVIVAAFFLWSIWSLLHAVVKA